MFHRPRRHVGLALALATALGVLPFAAGPVAGAVVAVLADAIAPGVVQGSEGFGTATVLVPKGGYVTYLVRTDSRLRGKRIQVWTDSGAGWRLTTTRKIANDGSIHYFARVRVRTGFWAHYVDGGTPPVTSHARAAAVSADGTTIIRLACEDVAPTGAAVKSIVGRTVTTTVRGTIRVIVCASPSTGFAWTMASLDTAHLRRVGHTLHVRSGPPGSAGTETWSLRLIEPGIGRATLVFSQPWRGGEKAAWTLLLTIQSA